MMDKTKKILQRLRNTATNISFSFNTKIKKSTQKNQKNLQNKTENHINFLHICETNERDNNFNMAQSKAHIKYITPVSNNFANTFFIINNPNENKTGGGSIIIISEKLHNHLESTELLRQGRYILTT